MISRGRPLPRESWINAISPPLSEHNDGESRPPAKDGPWDGVAFCPVLGCSVYLKDGAALMEHFLRRHITPSNEELWVSRPVPLEPRGLSLAPVKLRAEDPSMRSLRKCRRFNVPELPAENSDWRWRLSQARVGSFLGTEELGFLELQLNPMREWVILEWRRANLVNQTFGLSHQVVIPVEGVEDILLLSSSSSMVEFVIKARVWTFVCDARLWNWAEPRGKATKINGPSALWLTIRAPLLSAHSFLKCLRYAVGHSTELGTDAALLPTQLGVGVLAGHVRKVLIQRDARNRGLTDEWMTEAGYPVHDLLSRYLEPDQGHLSLVPQLVRTEPDRRDAVDAGVTPTIAVVKTEMPVVVPSPPPAPRDRVHMTPEQVPLPDDLVSMGQMPHEKPKTGYQLFHRARVAEYKEKFVGIKHQEAYKKAAKDWSNLKESERKPWFTRADIKPWVYLAEAERNRSKREEDEEGEQRSMHVEPAEDERRVRPRVDPNATPSQIQ